MNKLLLFTLLFCTATVNAQYNLTVLENQTYTEIANPTFEVPDDSQFWGNVSTKGNMNFKAFSSTYDLVNNSVFIPLKQGYAYFTNNTRSTTLYAARGLFDGRKGANQTSVFSFANETVGGDNIFKMQWKNMGFETGDSNDFINFQMWIYENSGVIEMRYGAMSVSNNLWENNANGPIVGLLEMDNNFTNIFNRVWLTGNSQSPVETKTGTFLAMDNVPQTGTVYKFTPSSSTGLVSYSTNNIQVYPTVISNVGYVTIKGDFVADEVSEVKIYNSLGQKVKSQTIASNTERVELPSLANGVYWMNLEKNGVVTKTVKLIK
jgi:hypothetical protein